MAPTSTKMDQAVSTTLLSQLLQQQIITSILTSESENIQFVNEFQYERKNTNNKQEHGIPGTTPGYYMGRQSVTDAVTNTLVEC